MNKVCLCIFLTSIGPEKKMRETYFFSHFKSNWYGRKYQKGQAGFDTKHADVIKAAALYNPISCSLNTMSPSKPNLHYIYICKF